VPDLTQLPGPTVAVVGQEFLSRDPKRDKYFSPRQEHEAAAIEGGGTHYRTFGGMV